MFGWSRTGGARRGAALAALSIALLACSAIVYHADSQCSVNTDCARFPGTVCLQGGCVAGPTPPEGGVLDLDAPTFPSACTTNQDCLSEHAGENWICQRRDATCVSLLSSVCPSVVGSYTSDSALLVGAVLPLSGPHASTGRALANAIALAVSDFDRDPYEGLPPLDDGGILRPIAVVFCDENQGASAATDYLVDTLAIPIVIGAGDSASTIAIAPGVVDGGQFLMSPRATANLSAFTGSRRVWRTCPSDAIEADAITALMEAKLEPALLGQQPALTVAVVHATDVESQEIDARISSTLTLNGAPATASSNAEAFLDVPFGDPDDPTTQPDYGAAIAGVTSPPGALPDAIILLGSTQAVANVLGGIETHWPSAATKKPFYVLSSSMQVQELLDYVAHDPSVAQRILGTAPGSNPATYDNLGAFLINYETMFEDSGTAPAIFGAAQAYDALYAVAYAATVARNTDLVGLDVTNALRQMLAREDGSEGGEAPVPVDVGLSGIPGAFSALAAGKKLTLNGASAPLPFDVTTGDLVTSVQVWCVVPAAGSSFAFQDSNLYYDPAAPPAKDGGASGSLEGSLADGGCPL